MNSSKVNFVEELKWRGLLHDIMPGTEELLLKETVTGYCGFDPTADSLHVGSMIQIMLLRHLQKAGHKPIALIGGATGRIGDPSGKSEERSLLSLDHIQHNLDSISKQLEKFLDFNIKDNPAEILNNYDWFKDFSFLDFIRDIGKHITVSYMLSKDSVKNRMESGISFTEFSYQLVQGYDFYWLHKNKNCKLQIGGSDQWGNIVTGTELIRRIDGAEAFALTSQLLTRADGTKFGKSEGANVWLDPNKTSPFKFYQFWLNISDDEAEKVHKYFSPQSKEEILTDIETHKSEPHLRNLQRKIAEEFTTLVHGKEELQTSKRATEILFGKSTTEDLLSLSEKEILQVFEGVPQHEISKDLLSNGVNILDFLTDATGIFNSKGEARRSLQENAISINKKKTTLESIVNPNELLQNKFILIQKGKKNYYLVFTS